MIRYDGDCLSNRYYVKFTSDIVAKAAFEAINYLRLGENNLIAEAIRSSNVTDSKNYCCPNVFDGAEERAPKVCHPPTPYWFVAYYRKGRGNFIHAAKYLERNIGLPLQITSRNMAKVF